MNAYIGHPSQAARVEEHRLVGGKGDGMRLVEIDNGRGLCLTVSADRAADISRLSFKGINMGYFAPCGYVAPAYYDPVGAGFLKSFTAGFLTTCGLNAVGSPCEDAGEQLPLHGSIGNTPAENTHWEVTGSQIVFHADIRDEHLFGRKLHMHRVITAHLEQNELEIADLVTNNGDTATPIEIMYHINIGYPLLDEDAMLYLPSQGVTARDAHAENDMENWMKIEKPQEGYVERCYYHSFQGDGLAAIFQPKHEVGIAIKYDSSTLDCFTQWKMMGRRDYVLGLEPANCYPDGRDVMRKKGLLKYIAPNETIRYAVRFSMLSDVEAFSEVARVFEQ